MKLLEDQKTKILTEHYLEEGLIGDKLIFKFIGEKECKQRFDEILDLTKWNKFEFNDMLSNLFKYSNFGIGETKSGIIKCLGTITTENKFKKNPHNLYIYGGDCIDIINDVFREPIQEFDNFYEKEKIYFDKMPTDIVYITGITANDINDQQFILNNLIRYYKPCKKLEIFTDLKIGDHKKIKMYQKNNFRIYYKRKKYNKIYMGIGKWTELFHKHKLVN